MHGIPMMLYSPTPLQDALDLAELVLVDITDRLVAYGLVDPIGGRISRVGEQEAVPITLVQKELAKSRNAGAGVAFVAVFRRGVDVVDGGAVGARPGAPGSLQGLVFAVDDLQATYEELRGKGVPFDFAPRKMPGGLQAVFRDPDGNGFVLAGG